MTNLYVFSLAVGAPLLLWFIFSGDTDGGDGGGDADGGGILGFLSLSTLSFVLTFFGLAGLLLEGTGVTAALALTFAVVIGVIAGAANSGALRWVRRNSASSDVLDSELEGAIASVAMPISSTHRGKIVLSKAGAREQMTASPVDGSSIDSGERVVIVRIERGVALVAPLGPGLELD